MNLSETDQTNQIKIMNREEFMRRNKCELVWVAINNIHWDKSPHHIQMHCGEWSIGAAETTNNQLHYVTIQGVMDNSLRTYQDLDKRLSNIK